jgi:phosphoribosylglycinamide formyltransferase
MAPVCRITAMCSGSGTNLQALIDAVEAGRIADSKIVRVVVNRKNAFAATRAATANIPSDYFNLVKDGFQAAGEKDPSKLAEARRSYDGALAERVLRDEPDLVVLAGWMHVFSPAFLKPLEEKGVAIINLHPALPGAPASPPEPCPPEEGTDHWAFIGKYDGANAIQRAYDDFQAGKLENNRTGVMIHYAIAEVDRGEPILTQEVECREGEDLAQLEERIHAVEHELIVRATAQVSGEIVSRKRI